MDQKYKYYIYPYKAGSRSASALSAALGGRVLKREGSKFVPGKYRKVINWGSSTCPWDCLNSEQDVTIAGNKLSFFNYLSNKEDPPRVPQWTASREVAQGWLRGSNQHTTGFKCRAVVARQSVTGHSGQGIVITEKGGEVPAAPLYVEYVPKDAEYRIHVFNGEVIDVQRKVRDPEKEVVDWAVRSHSNGFIFTRNTGDGRRHADVCPPDVVLQAQKAMGVSGLCFGGVDVLWNEKRKQAYVLEINTACGLEGDTPNIYAAAIRKYYK
jgi:hypothetical protein